MRVDAILRYDFDFKNPNTLVEFPPEPIAFLGGIGPMKLDNGQLHFHKHRRSLHRMVHTGGSLQLLACTEESIEELQVAPNAILWMTYDDLSNGATRLYRLPK